MTKHIMVDIETFAKHNYAPIISIGAVAFDPTDPRRDFENFPEFLVNIDLESNLKIGRQMDAGTVLFWADPEQADALAQWKKTLKFELPLALDGFKQWVGTFDQHDLCVWSYGSNFDLVILGTAFTQLGIETPWSYRGERCFRTLKSLAPDAQVPQVGTTHNALDDARYQTRLFYQVAMELDLKF